MHMGYWHEGFSVQRVQVVAQLQQYSEQLRCAFCFQSLELAQDVHLPNAS